MKRTIEKCIVIRDQNVDGRYMFGKEERIDEILRRLNSSNVWVVSVEERMPSFGE
jgi:hypothetical protein